MAVDKTDLPTLHVEEKPYTTLINDVVQGLSNPDALAIWVYLQSKSSGWKVVASHLQAHFGIGRTRYREAMRCLHGEGLITYVSQRDEGGHLLGKEIIVHWRPKLAISPNVQETERSVKPTLGEKTPYEIQDSFTKEIEGTKRSAEAELVDDAFALFWDAGMRKSAKPQAYRAFSRACKAYSGGAMEFAEMLASDVQARKAAGQLGFEKMMPSTYLNNRRWEDEKPAYCPHEQIAKIWNELMPDHIAKVSVEDWTPMAKGYADLQHAWEELTTKPRASTGRPAFTTVDEGLEFYRLVWGKLAKSRVMQEARSADWCRFTWAVQIMNTVDIAKGNYD